VLIAFLLNIKIRLLVNNCLMYRNKTKICNILETEIGKPTFCPPAAFTKYIKGSKIRDQI
jgi:hypothetical protein